MWSRPEGITVKIDTEMTEKMELDFHSNSLIKTSIYFKGRAKAMSKQTGTLTERWKE